MNALSAVEREGVVASKPQTRLSAEEEATVVTLLRQRMSVPEIAEVLGRGEGAVERVAGMARLTLAGGAVEAAVCWMEAAKVAAAKGFHKPAKEWLEAAGVVERATAQPVAVAQATVVVQGFALPGLPVGPVVGEG